jgi:hypothetical protein
MEIDVKRGRQTSKPRRFFSTIVMVFSAMLIAQPVPYAHATPQGCPDEAGINRQKFIFGSLEKLGGNTELTERAVLNALELSFDWAGANLDSFADIFYCADRTSRESGNFDQTVTQALNDEQVLLEVGARLAGTRILVAYVVIPLRFYEYFENSRFTMPGYHKAYYEISRISEGVDALFLGNAELKLLAALALAVHHEKAADAIDDPTGADEVKAMLLRSSRYYCEAVGSIEAAHPKSGVLGLSNEDWDRIGRYAREGADRVQARLNQRFGTGSTIPVVESIREGTSAAERACGESLPGGGG